MKLQVLIHHLEVRRIQISKIKSYIKWEIKILKFSINMNWYKQWKR